MAFTKYRLLFIILATFQLPVSAEFTGVSEQKLKTLMARGVPVIDIRTPGEWDKTGVIPNSEQLTYFDKDGNVDREAWLKKFRQTVTSDEQEFVLVCHSGGRSTKVGQMLDQQFGLKNVYHLENGIAGWIKHDGAVEQSALPQSDNHK